jgi:CheY-like chemotaxis protein
MDEGKPGERPVYSIGAVSKMLGIPAATLRTWQERYGIVIPERSEGGHRLYTRDQLQQLRFLSDQVAAGMSPADGHRLLSERLASGQPLQSAGAPGRETLLILLAEQDPFAAEFAEYFLRTEGYAVDLVRTVEDAVAKSASDGPQLVVIDLMISGGRGLELCQQVREHDGVPVLAISSLAMREQALAAGASAFLLKPVEALQLVSTVQDLLGRSAFLRRGERLPERREKAEA